MKFSEEFSERMMIEYGFGQRYAEKSFKDFQIITTEHKLIKPAAVKYVKEYQLNEDNLLMIGSKGTGKTFTASLISKSLYQYGLVETMYYARLHSLLSEVKSGFANVNNGINNGEKRENNFVKALYADLLILDEVGSYALTNYDYQQFFTLIDERYSNKLKTIFITNCDSVETFSSFLQAPIADRAFESIQIFEFGYTSVRSLYKKQAANI